MSARKRSAPEDVQDTPRKLKLEPKPKYSPQLPEPRTLNGKDGYKEPVYYGKTCNPLVALAIVRLAERNMSFINFDSALNHLPNVRPRDPIPRLPNMDEIQFLDEVPYAPKPHDEKIGVVYFPNFYKDSRHAIGFSTRTHDNKLCSILYTPCVDQELVDFRLKQVVVHQSRQSEPRVDDSIYGTVDGKWYYGDEVEDYGTWRLLWAEVGEKWKWRISLGRGVHEDSRGA